MMKRARVALSVGALLSLAVAVRADDVWNITTSDFRSESVTPQSIDDSNFVVAATDGATKAVPLASFVQLTKSAPRKPPVGLVLCVAGGQRLVGQPRRIDGNNLVWFTSGVGEVAVPVENCLGILRDRTTIDGLSDARAEDTAKLTTGDAVHGILTEASDSALTFTPATGDPVKVSPATVALVLFASPPGGRPAVAAPAYLVRITGGSVIAASSITLDSNQLKFRTPSGTMASVPWSQVEAIEHAGGPIAWLSSREPTEAMQTPYFDAKFPARMDVSVTGGPIRFGGVTYTRGIGVHSRSMLTFAIQPGDQTFRTRYAIDGNQPVADVDVTISLDGKPVHQKIGVKAGELSPLIEIKLGDAKTLTLEVDYGKNLDVQDRLNWIEPAIVRASE
ncbi:MAG: putative carbohydrate binding protein [Phycisphaerales bacterium]|nr:putative carbohydrate binding protein [Phycisphaerales bacterium]